MEYNSIRFSYNKLKNTEHIKEAITFLLKDPLKIKWLDLSFNEIIELDESICAFENLTTLYLHSNKITDLNKLMKILTRLPSLKIITLHGNLFTKNYKIGLLNILPKLKQIDFTGVSLQDRQSARILASRQK